MEAAESGKIGADTEFLTDIFGKGADVGAGAAVNLDFKLGIVVIKDFDTFDFDFTGRSFEVFVLSG